MALELEKALKEYLAKQQSVQGAHKNSSDRSMGKIV